MKILKTAYEELVSMFIDDGALALFALLLIIIVAVGVKMGHVSGFVGGVILLVGCILILAESVSRAAKAKFRKKP